MNNNVMGDPIFNMTSFPVLNDFIDQVKALYSMEITISEFSDAVDNLDNFRRKAKSVLADQLRSNVVTPEKKKEISHIEKRLESFQSAIGEIRTFFKDSDKKHIESGLERCKRYFEEIWSSIESLKKQENAEIGKYSKAPAQNEIMRIAEDVVAGRLSKSILKEKISNLKKNLKNYYYLCGDIAEGDPGAYYLELHKDEIKKAVKDYVKSLDETEKYFVSGDSSVLKAALKKASLAAEVLLEHQEKITDAKITKSCVKCGAENDYSAKYCSSCNAVMPEIL